MPPSHILDSHIHLWPSTALEPTNHAWMTPGHPLVRCYGIDDYLQATVPQPAGFIYVETDRYLPSPTPAIQPSDGDVEKRRRLESWAKEPIEEMKYLRRVVEGKPEEGDGFTAGDGEHMKGCVLWAPFNLDPPIFQLFLSLAKEVAGPALWERVVGFRYLLQGKADGEVQKLVSSEAWLDNVASLRHGRRGRGWAFDIGVDTHRDGVERLGEVADMIAGVRKRDTEGNRVRFVLNHLCKPPLSPSRSTPHPAYQSQLTALGRDPDIYMKLSGALNEFADGVPTPDNVADLICAVEPFWDLVLASFPGRVMFGSDWPVCNVGGPKGVEGNWRLWREVVEEGVVLGRKGGAEVQKSVMWKAAGEAYGVDVYERKSWVL